MNSQENDDFNLSPADRRAIRSFRRLIASHQKKVEEFYAQPTVRPGMESLASAVIRAQQQARVERLLREIRKFEAEIARRRGGVERKEDE
jgi:7,8-dihydro-6-hydroxymethylpterin-pyrophosphokinase